MSGDATGTVRESIRLSVRETAVSVSLGRIDSVRTRRIVRSGCRVYADGCLGVAGTLGEATAATWAEAEANLALRIPYPYTPGRDLARARDLRGPALADDAFVRACEGLLEALRRRHPEYLFSNRIALTETETTLANDAGLDLVNRDRSVVVALIIKHRDSVHIFDAGLFRQDRAFDAEALLADARELLDAFGRKAVRPVGEKVLAVLQADLVLGKLEESLNGESVAKGASLFCGRMGERLFSPAFSLVQDRTDEAYHVPFFDMEGVVNPGDRVPLIENGVLLRPYSDRKAAALLGEPSTGAASGAYDETPGLSGTNLSIVPGTRTLAELLGGEPALAVLVASGGDFTPRGDFASPVQLAMRIEDGRLQGRLPDCSVRGNLFELFGDDFVGLSSDRPFMGERALVVRLAVSDG